MFLFFLCFILATLLFLDAREQMSLKRWTKIQIEKNTDLEHIKKIKMANINQLEGVLTAIAIELADTYWSKEFKVEIKISKELDSKKCLGAYVYLSYEKNIIPVTIFLSETMIKQKNPYLVLDTLKHELCHWALSIDGKKFDDTDLEFKRELKKIKAMPSGFFKEKDVFI